MEEDIEIPKTIICGGRAYKLIKEYPNYYMYEDAKTGIKTCFKRQELIKNKNSKKPWRSKYEREKYE